MVSGSNEVRTPVLSLGLDAFKVYSTDVDKDLETPLHPPASFSSVFEGNGHLITKQQNPLRSPHTRTALLSPSRR